MLAAVDQEDTSRKRSCACLGRQHPTISHYLRLRRETSSVTPKPSPERPPRVGGTAEQRRALWAQIEAHPEATLEHHRQM